MSPYIPGKSTTISQLHYYPNGVSWDSAEQECGQYGLENDQYIIRSISELEGKTLWIGEKVYHLTLPWILGRYLDTDVTMFAEESEVAPPKVVVTRTSLLFTHHYKLDHKFSSC